MFDSELLRRESGGNIGAINPRSGAMGKWQFMPRTLQGLGYQGSRENFLSNENLQDEFKQKFDQQNLQIGYNSGVISPDSSPIEKQNFLRVAHLGGPGGAVKYYKTGGRYNPSDGATRLSDYANMGRTLGGGVGRDRLMGDAGEDRVPFDISPYREPLVPITDTKKYLGDYLSPEQQRAAEERAWNHAKYISGLRMLGSLGTGRALAQGAEALDQSYSNQYSREMEKLLRPLKVGLGERSHASEEERKDFRDTLAKRELEEYKIPSLDIMREKASTPTEFQMMTHELQQERLRQAQAEERARQTKIRQQGVAVLSALPPTLRDRVNTLYGGNQEAIASDLASHYEEPLVPGMPLTLSPKKLQVLEEFLKYREAQFRAAQSKSSTPAPAASLGGAAASEATGPEVTPQRSRAISPGLGAVDMKGVFLNQAREERK